MRLMERAVREGGRGIARERGALAIRATKGCGEIHPLGLEAIERARTVIRIARMQAIAPISWADPQNWSHAATVCTRGALTLDGATGLDIDGEVAIDIDIDIAECCPAGSPDASSTCMANSPTSSMGTAKTAMRTRRHAVERTPRNSVTLSGLVGWGIIGVTAPRRSGSRWPGWPLRSGRCQRWRRIGAGEVSCSRRIPTRRPWPLPQRAD